MSADQPAPSRPAVLAAFVGFPVALTAADLVAPSFAHGADLAAAVAAHPVRTWLLAGLRLADAALLLGVALAVWLVARRSGRGGTLAAVAAVLATLGALGQAQDAAYQLMVLSLRDRPAADAGAILTRLDRLAAPLELPLLLAFALALPLLAGALRRAGAVPRWPVIAAAGAFVLHFAPGMLFSRAADALLIAAFVGAAVVLVSGRGPADHPVDRVTAATAAR